jgi:hypothetical protein
MIIFPCQVCRTSLSANESEAGQLKRCPTCRTTLRVPIPEAVTAGAPSAPPPAARPSAASLRQFMGVPRSGGKRYGFNCPYCSSRLEATEAMAAQDGQCPTCGNQITIPIQDRYGRLIDPKTREIIKQDPHPVHAYAAAGDRAPKIIRNSDGRQFITCPRCSATSLITSNNCGSCGMPFTMEGTTIEVSSSSNGFAVASIVLGFVGIAPCMFALPGILAITFGIIALVRISNHEGAQGKGLAIAGISLGVLGLLITAHYQLGLF